MRNKKEIEEAIKVAEFNWLGRKTFMEDFIQHLQNQKESRHICINGVWGSGKTTTILVIIHHLEKLNDEDKPLVLYLDAWKYEHYQHPLFALLKVMEEKLPNIFKEIQSDIQKKGIGLQVGVNSPFFGVTLSENKDDTYNRLMSEAEYIDVLNQTMIKAVKKFKEERANELILFIDELDRAKPDFALRTLEMFHHLQDDLPTHVIYSVDMNQLSSMIKHYYGYEYNVEIFTHKVFDEVITLKKLTKNEISTYIEEKLRDLSVGYNVRMLRELMMKYMKQNQLESLRTINKVCESLREKLNTGYFKRNQNRSYYLEDFGREVREGYIELLVVLELFTLTDPMKIYDFLRGDNISELLNFILARGKVSKGIGFLIEASYDYRKGSDDYLDYSKLSMEERIKGLKKVFVPVNEVSFEKALVFSNGEIF